MTKRTLYARLRFVLQLAAIGVHLLAAGPAAGQPAACATCLVPVVTPGETALFPESLAGFDILVRVEAGGEQAAAKTLDVIAERRGRPGLLVTGVPAAAPDPSLMARVHTVVIHLDGKEEAAGLFALRKLLAAMRGSAPSVTYGVAAPTRELARELAASVDFIVIGSAAGSYGLPAEWRIFDGSDATAALAATQSHQATRWLWFMPEDATLAARGLRELTRPIDRPSEDVLVVAGRRLTADEIVARHQAASAKQAAAIREIISTATLTITFEAPGFAAPVTISSETVIYAGTDRTDLEQRHIRINGIEFRGGGIPQLPIVEPERAASPPLAITLTNVYRYSLAGEDEAAGTRCYVVAFEPARSEAAASTLTREPVLFKGRAWIAMDTFAMVKVAAAQTGLRGAIVSSEQIETFREDPSGLWLLARSEIRQLYEGAGHRTPIVRVLQMTSHDVNPPDFDARRSSAYASNHVMLRDTPQGYRYLKRSETADGSASVEPIVAGRAERIRMLAAGVIVDPNITRPLPFAGLSYVDFNLFGTGAQLNAFFGGTYGQLAFSVPSLRGSRWQLAGRAFGIASSYNDRAFTEGRERYEHNILQRPAHAAVWLVRPLTTRMSVRAGYELDYTRFARGSGTALEFVEPQNQIVHGARLAFDAQRGGWAASIWWNPARRHAWRRWGTPDGEYGTQHRDFQRYGASTSRAVVVTPSVIARLEAAWMSGRDLDRFSRYAFGSFDNRLHGYPSALIRYDRGAVLRSAITWTAGRFVRFDAFVDSAAVRDAAYGRRVRNYTGVGGAVETPAPFGTLLAIEWGYGFRGVNTDGRLGTQVVRVSAFKVF
jgi:hypothetical protein